MDNRDNNVNKSAGFCGLLTIVFITLKLIGVIKWNWVWVLSPLWAQALLIMITAVVVAIFLARER